MVRIGLHEFLELHQRELLARDLLALGLADPLHFQSERHVAERGAPGNSWAKSWNTTPRSRPWPSPPCRRCGSRRRWSEKAGDDVEQGGLAAARWPDDADELGYLDGEAHLSDALDLPAGVS